MLKTFSGLRNKTMGLGIINKVGKTNKSNDAAATEKSSSDDNWYRTACISMKKNLSQNFG